MLNYFSLPDIKPLFAGASAILASAALLVGGCGDNGGGGDSAATGGDGDGRTVIIGMVAKSQSNDVFQAAYQGAKDAAGAYAEAHPGVSVEIDWRTPASEDAAKQVEAIEALVRAQVDAILVSCTDAATLTPAIDRAVEAGVPVMTFDSDAPDSQRFAYYGTNNAEIGEKIMGRLVEEMPEGGSVAILGGNPSGTNLAARIQAAKDELSSSDNVKLLDASGGVFYHEETPEKAAEAVAIATNANPDIKGWALVGGWPLFTRDALRWEPGQIKVVSCDALPPQLDYVRSGHVQALFAQDCYGWGSKGVETILAKVIDNSEPEDPMIYDPLTEVTQANVDEYAKKWEEWLGE